MIRQIITIFISVLLLVSQIALADSKHRFRYYDSDKHESSKYKGFSRSIRAKLKSLGVAITEINTQIEALKLQVGDLPPDLDAQLVALQSTIDNNASDISLALTDIVIILQNISLIMSTQGDHDSRLNLLESGVVEISTNLDLLTSTVEDLELRVLALEQVSPPTAGVNFSGVFLNVILESCSPSLHRPLGVPQIILFPSNLHLYFH